MIYESFETIYFMKSPINNYSPEFYIYCEKRVTSTSDIINDTFDNIYYANIWKLIHNLENQINMQLFIYDSYNILSKKYSVFY